jgi:uncharacterized membrane protein YbhN (UPF0104 family)
VRTAFTVVVVVAIFAGLLPRLADYSGAWGLVRAMTGPEIALVAVAGAVNVVSYAPMWAVAAPGLGWRRALMTEQVSTAISNTVPAGFAFGLGTTAAMFHSFGFSPGAITRAIGLTGLWNNLVKLAMPAFALAGVALVGEVSGGLAVAAVLGSALLLLVVSTLLLVLTHPGVAAAVAGRSERVAGAVARSRHRGGPSGWVGRAERFRAGSLDLLRECWVRLSAAAVFSHAALFVLLLTCLRAIDGAGSHASWIVVLAVFSVTRLVTLLQITPGALGVAELSYVAGLTAVGVGAGAATGAVLVFRLLTWFLPIPLGAVAWLLWRRGVGRDRPRSFAPVVART